MSVFLTVCVSAALGFLSGLGVGGGSLLILWLTLVCGMEYASAKYINLLFFLPPALISTVVRLMQKQLSAKRILPAALAGSICAAALTVISSAWDVGLLRKLFGILLLLTAFRELKYSKKQPTDLHS